MHIVKIVAEDLNIREKSTLKSKVVGQIRDYEAHEAEPAGKKTPVEWFKLAEGGFVKAEFVGEAELDNFKFDPEPVAEDDGEETQEETQNGTEL